MKAPLSSLRVLRILILRGNEGGASQVYTLSRHSQRNGKLHTLLTEIHADGNASKSQSSS